jgi:hypothetical protein
MLLRMPKSVKEWTLTLQSEFPCWELKSQMNSEPSECEGRGQNLLHWRFFHIIGKLLKFRCLKWARIAHLNIWNTSYGQKKGRESNWQFDSWPLKVRNRSNFLACMQRATYRWKAFDESYNFALDFIAIEGLHMKLCSPKVTGVPVVEFRDSYLGVLGQKAIWMWSSWRGAEYTTRGEGGGFPQVRAVGSLVCSNCSWFVLAPKVLQLCTNHFVLVLCRFV